MLRVLVILLATLAAGSAVAKCRYNNDPLKNCEDALSDWWDNNSSHQSQSGDDIQHRTSSLRGTLQECKDCVMDKLESAADRASTSTDTNTSAGTNDPN
jgi:hypothetical protein